MTFDIESKKKWKKEHRAKDEPLVLPGFEFPAKVVVLCIVLAGVLMSCNIAHAETYVAEEIADAIYLAEGGARAKKPFGILSVPCNGYEDCRRICINTIQNNFTRWQVAGAQGDFLEFLANRYCPVGAENDPTGLNKNWLRNVRALLAKGGRS